MARGSLFPDDRDVRNFPKISGRRGRLIWRPWRGKIIVQSMPRYTPDASLAAIRPWTVWLRFQNLLWHYSNARVRAEFLRHERLSKVLARDWFMSHSRGLVFSYEIPGLGVLVSAASVERFSRSLDVFGQRLGDILVRGDEYWSSLPVGSDGQVLSVKDGVPQWVNPTSVSPVGGWFPAESLALFSTVLVTLYTHVRAVRLPYLTEGAATLNLLVPGGSAENAPLFVKAFLAWPGTASGRANHYLDTWAILATGEPLYLGRVYRYHDLSDGLWHWYEETFPIPALPSSLSGLTVRVGRAGQESTDTATDYTYLVGMRLE